MTTTATTPTRYALTEEHRAKLPAHRDWWIKNAMRTGLLTPEERERVARAVEGLYASAGLEKPGAIVFVPSPFAGRFAAGFAAGVLWLKKNPNSSVAATVAATSAATFAATHETTFAATREATGAATRAATCEATGAATRETTCEATREATGAATADWYALGGCTVRDMRRIAELFGRPVQFMVGCVDHAWVMCDYGNEWSDWIAYLSFFKDVVGLDLPVYQKFQHYQDAALAGPRWMHEEFCIVSEPPIKRTVDDRNRPHCADGPFCEWADGSRLYAFHGTRVPGWILETPEKITVEKIKAENNADIRRVMVEKYGPDRYFTDTGAKVLDTDRLSLVGSTTRALIEDNDGDRWLVGSDGSTGRVYFMPAPRAAKTCREAHEALCGFSEDLIKAEG